MVKVRSANKHWRHRHSCFWLFDLKKSSPLKSLCQMNRNLVGSILGRSSINSAHIVPIHLQTWQPQAILVSDLSISKKVFFSETALPNESKLGRKHHWKFLYKDCTLSSNPFTNMAATVHSFF